MAPTRTLWEYQANREYIVTCMKGIDMTADEWNQMNPPGTPVTLREDDGSDTETVTRSIAWNLGHDQPVVKVEGKSGGYALERIKPRQSTLVEVAGDRLFYILCGSQKSLTKQDCHAITRKMLAGLSIGT